MNPPRGEGSEPVGREPLPVDCIVLAAGLSSRMGVHKLTLPFRGKTVVEWSVDNALRSCRRVFVVTGYGAERVERLLGGRPGVVSIRNPGYEGGMFTSIRRGAEAVLSGPASAVFITLGDMPLIDPETYRILFERFSGSAAELRSWRPEHEGRGGHPILISRALLERVPGLPPESSMRELFAAEGAPIAVRVEDPNVLRDIDTPEDYRELTGAP